MKGVLRRHGRVEGHVAAEAETGGMQPQAKGCLEPLGQLEASRSLPWSLQRELTLPAWTSACWPPELGGLNFSQLVAICHSSPRKGRLAVKYLGSPRFVPGKGSMAPSLQAERGGTEQKWGCPSPPLSPASTTHWPNPRRSWRARELRCWGDAASSQRWTGEETGGTWRMESSQDRPTAPVGISDKETVLGTQRWTVFPLRGRGGRMLCLGVQGKSWRGPTGHNAEALPGPQKCPLGGHPSGTSRWPLIPALPQADFHKEFWNTDPNNEHPQRKGAEGPAIHPDPGI